MTEAKIERAPDEQTQKLKEIHDSYLTTLNNVIVYESPRVDSRKLGHLKPWQELTVLAEKTVEDGRKWMQHQLGWTESSLLLRVIAHYVIVVPEVDIYGSPATKSSKVGKLVNGDKVAVVYSIQIEGLWWIHHSQGWTISSFQTWTFATRVQQNASKALTTNNTDDITEKKQTDKDDKAKPKFQFNACQNEVIECYSKGISVILCGKAGAGKTYVCRHLLNQSGRPQMEFINSQAISTNIGEGQIVNVRASVDASAGQQTLSLLLAFQQAGHQLLIETNESTFFCQGLHCFFGRERMRVIAFS